MAQEAKKLEVALSETSPNEAAEAALEKAAEAMQRAAEALEQGRASETTEAQREAVDALEEAGKEARAGVRPDEAKAAELAAEQKEIEDDLLDLATRLAKEEREEAAAAVQRAASEAKSAAESLEQGDLSEAKEAERRVEEKLDEARADLQEEEEKYQELRREEVLIRLTEELAALLEGHRAQLAEVEEIEAARGDRETPSRAQKLRLRSVAREEATLSEKAAELTAALQKEGSDIFASAMDEVRDDLERAALLLGQPGESGAGAGFDSSWRTQGLMRDAERLLVWLHEALTEEAQRRRDEAQDPDEEKPPEDSQGEQQSQEEQQGENRLVPSQAELRLLRSMELDVQRSIAQTLDAYPELADTAPEDSDPLLLEDIMRLAGRHNRITELFRGMAKKLGVPGIGDEAGGGQ